MSRALLAFRGAVAVIGLSLAAAGAFARTPRTEGSLVSPEDIRFVVMPDRTGGMRSGVFREALERANLLHPELLLSVGDLIDGYTLDPDLLEAQWAEFDAMVAELDAPFYYVPGNHDISNAWMEEQWSERLGDPYYHFVYKDALFLALHTEDGGVSGISDTQADYFVQALAEHEEVRWTFVFMHRPLWSYDDQEGFERIGAALAERRYTLFSGHHHNYYYEADAAGNESMILATAGGGSGLRGAAFGEFDHVTHVVLTAAGPKVTHLKLDGFVDKEVVNPANRGRVEALRRGAFAEARATVSTARETPFLAGEAWIRNPEASVLRAELRFPDVAGVAFEAEQSQFVVAPGEAARASFRMVAAAGGLIALDALPPIYLTVVGGYSLDGDGAIELPSEPRWRVDWPHPIGATHLGWEQMDPPAYFEEGWDWRGPEDARLRFALRDDGDAVEAVVEAYDERLLFGDGPLSDRFTLYFESGGTASAWEFVPLGGDRLRSPDGFRGEAQVEEREGGLRLTVRLPKEQLGMAAGARSFRFNLKYMDHDRPENQKPSRLYWRPAWGSGEDYAGAGTFWFE